jgi:hypothetical protein
MGDQDTGEPMMFAAVSRVNPLAADGQVITAVPPERAMTRLLCAVGRQQEPDDKTSAPVHRI